MRGIQIGLTGGIGSGKTAVATRLAERGAVIIDADRIAREIVEPGQPALAEIREAFGDGVITADGALDRPALATVVFSDEESRLKLNAITHPRIDTRSKELIEAAGPEAVIVYDMPLLIETGAHVRFELVVVVDTPDEIRVQRLVTSRGMALEDAWARIASQATREQRLEKADVVIDNAGTPEALDPQIDALWARLDEVRSGPAPA